MKDATQQALEACRPTATPLEGVQYCLKKLYEDSQHKCLDKICPDLTYEEVIGVLLQARDLITTGQVTKPRGRRYFRGHVIKFFDETGNVNLGPWKTQVRW